jgi:WD40 repeat protein
MVLLYPMNAANQEGLLVGFIQAKGLHTNLLLKVKITDDSRFCFVGVLKGTSEMIAIDLGRLNVMESFQVASIKKKAPLTAEGIVVYKHNDPKLRGFGAVVRVHSEDDSTAGARYRLACGKGIKNVHIWQFTPPEASAQTLTPRWTCMYDVASNGNTIESVGFRCGGHEALSKSKDANLRVWDLRQYDVDPLAKPTFEDVPNSSDVRCLLDDFAIGGLYNFAIVKLGAPKEANRDAFDLPERSVEDDNGQRRKRMSREVDDVIGTQDAKHVLCLCTDGGVIYYRNNSTEDFSVQEFSRLQRDPESERAWAVGRVGQAGHVVLMRAIKDVVRSHTTIQVQLLDGKLIEIYFS